MTREQFMEAIVKYLRNGAFEDTIENLEDPPGRFPSEKLKLQSAWYKALPQDNKIHLQEAIKEGIDSALFGFFCIIDGVRKVVDDEGDFNITFNDKALQDDSYDFHDLYNAHVSESESGSH
jgi:hypothetical protein